MDHWRPRTSTVCSICLSIVLLLSLLAEEKEVMVQAHHGVGKHLYRLLKKSRFIPIPIIIPVHHSHHSEHHHHHHHKKHHKHDHGRSKRQLMPGPPFLPFAGPMQGSASMAGGVHTIPSLQHHKSSHQNFPLQMHHYGSPYIPFPGVDLGQDPGKAFAILSNKRLMFMAILKATVKLYFELGVLLSMAMGTLWMIFGSGFTRIVQMGLHAVGNTFLSLGSTIHNSHVVKKSGG